MQYKPELNNNVQQLKHVWGNFVLVRYSLVKEREKQRRTRKTQSGAVGSGSTLNRDDGMQRTNNNILQPHYWTALHSNKSTSLCVTGIILSQISTF